MATLKDFGLGVALAEKALKNGITKPELPFPSLCMDGMPCIYRRSPGKGAQPFPSAHDVPEERLEDFGVITTHEDLSLLSFIDLEGKYWLARDVEPNRRALKMAGYHHDIIYGSWDASVVPNLMGKWQLDETVIEHLKHISAIPHNEAERLAFAMCDSNLTEFNAAHESGATYADADVIWKKSYAHDPLIIRAMQNPATAERDEIIRRILPEVSADISNLRNQGLLHKALATEHSTVSIIPDFLMAKADILKRDQDGAPAFLALNVAKPTAREEWVLVAQALTAYEGLTPKQVALLRMHVAIVDTALEEMAGSAEDQKKQSLDKARNTITALRGAWTKGTAWTKPDDTVKIPPRTETLLAPLIDKQRVSRFVSLLPHYQPQLLNGVDDLVEEFTSHIVLPQANLECARELGFPVDDAWLSMQEQPYWLNSLQSAVKYMLFGERALDKIIGLNAAWHAPEVIFPDHLKPLQAKGEWHSLISMQKPLLVPGMPGITIQPLTRDTQLREVSATMQHCVRNYISQCLEGRIHIFLICKEGNDLPLSTLGGRWNGKVFEVTDNTHTSFDNKSPCHEAVQAAAWLKQAIESRDPAITLNTKQGETQASKEINGQRPVILRKIGFEVTQDNINRAFAEYCHNERRCARGYNPETGRFNARSQNKTRLISGTYNGILLEADGTPKVRRDRHGVPQTDKAGKPLVKVSVSYEDLTADQWFEVTGLRERAMEIMRPFIDQYRDELKSKSKLLQL